MPARTAERTRFLSDLVIDGTGFFWITLLEFDEDTCRGKVRVECNENVFRTHEFGPDDISRGLRMYREYFNGERESFPGAWRLGWEVKGQKAPEGSYGWELILADETNGDDGDYDAITADAVMQFAFLGNLIYG